MRSRIGVLFALAIGGPVAFGVGGAVGDPCSKDDFTKMKWCKREVPGTNPQQYKLEGEVATTGSAGVVALVTSQGSVAGNLGAGKAGTSTSGVTGNNSPKTTITGSTTVMLQARDNDTPPCSPPVTLAQGNCDAASGNSQFIPTCP